VPTVKELVDRISAEAEEIMFGRLARLRAVARAAE